MYISLYYDAQVAAMLNTAHIPHAFDGNELETAPFATPIEPSRRRVFVEDKTHVRITANVCAVPNPPVPLTLLLEYSRDNGLTWVSANASVTFDSAGAHCGEWEQLPPDCYGDVIFRAVKSDEGGAACTVVSVAIQLR